MKINQRHEKIIELLSREGQFSVETLAQRLDVSLMTIRRDLKTLSQTGQVSRTHGGAVLSRTGSINFLFQQRENQNLPKKQAIAREVIRMIHPGNGIILDNGSTTLEVARAMSSMSDLTVLSSSLLVASVLHTNERMEVVLLGGVVRKNFPDLTGPLTEENLKGFRVHLAVVGADAASSEGTFTHDVRTARVTKVMTQAADRVVVVFDSSKFTKTALAHCLDWKDIHVVVTDEACPESIRSWLNKAVSKVIYAPLTPSSSQ
ncbi:MAG: DeoR/GlpR family DNA-binding transcription regulator [Verrucomicrobiae bacterium]|nr:DeoR/GlpR family DNA-binding transcription regulator [Verrucomicrobiae bacterium]